MLAAALFAMLAVGIYAHVDSWVTRDEIANNVLGRETSAVTPKDSTTVYGFARTMWCRLKYNKECNQPGATERTKVGEESMSTDALIERELKNIENEVRNDRGEVQGSNYWSM